MAKTDNTTPYDLLFDHLFDGLDPNIQHFFAKGRKQIFRWIRKNPGKTTLEIAQGVPGPNGLYQGGIHVFLYQLEKAGQIVRDPSNSDRRIDKSTRWLPLASRPA